MTPKIILDPHWRSLDELFAPEDLAALHDAYDLIWAQDGPMPADALAEALPEANALISTRLDLDAETLARAPSLKAVVEVSGAFPPTIDYATCFARGIEVLSCAPGFRDAAAEMALAMALSGARGLVQEHEHFRTGGENWLMDNTATDFTLFGATVGFVGFGQIARRTAELLAPFAPRILAHDPWLPPEIAAGYGIELVSLDEVMSRSRCLFVTAAPTASNRAMIGATEIAMMPQAALMVLVSRAHLVDFDAVVQAAAEDRIRAAIDVYPDEPLPPDHQLRQIPNVILSPHRAAAVARGRQLIGRMIRHDLDALFADRPERQLQVADPDRIGELAISGDAKKVGAMAVDRG
ncbi:MAG: NAD(P)-dependent oxidoreductase [Rhodobacter sp.]|nr:NAD(P)-dependent oxidoreductase [Rhodobacter sp.]